jgi:ribonuclease HII
VVVAAVILGQDWDTSHPLQDSKRIPEEERERLFPIIRKQAQAHRIIAVSPKAIDESNILQATLDGMSRSLRELHTPADYALVDGNRFPTMGLPGEAVVKGDSHSCSIAAASILAKVARDRIMRVYGQRYPEWGFEQHFGYPTPKHREAIQRHGLSPIHRRTFRWKPRPAQLDLL